MTCILTFCYIFYIFDAPYNSNTGIYQPFKLVLVLKERNGYRLNFMEENRGVPVHHHSLEWDFFPIIFLKHQTICEYTGTRLNISKLRPGTHCAFHIPGTKTFVDGGGEYSNCKRCIASFANHSDTPNAALQVWPIGRRHRVMLVTLDAILPGHELLINYNSGGRVWQTFFYNPGYSKPSYMGPYPESG